MFEGSAWDCAFSSPQKKPGATDPRRDQGEDLSGVAFPLLDHADARGGENRTHHPQRSMTVTGLGWEGMGVRGTGHRGGFHPKRIAELGFRGDFALAPSDLHPLYPGCFPVWAPVGPS